jgi:hypothetical protein
MTAEDITGKWLVSRPYLVPRDPDPDHLTEADVERILERLAVMSSKLDALEARMQSVQTLAQSNATARAEQDAKVAAFWANGPGKQWPAQLEDHERRLRLLESDVATRAAKSDGLREGGAEANDRWVRGIKVLKGLGLVGAGAGTFEILRVMVGG